MKKEKLITSFGNQKIDLSTENLNGGTITTRGWSGSHDFRFFSIGMTCTSDDGCENQNIYIDHPGCICGAQ